MLALTQDATAATPCQAPFRSRVRVDEPASGRLVAVVQAARQLAHLGAVGPSPPRPRTPRGAAGVRPGGKGGMRVRVWAMGGADRPDTAAPR